MLSTPLNLRLFVLAILLGGVSCVSSQTVWIEFNPVSSALNSTDDFLLPLTIGSTKQNINILPSLTQSTTFIIGPQACTPKGAKGPTDDCVLYRGGVFDTMKSSSFVVGKEEYNYRNSKYVAYSDGTLGKDRIVFQGEYGEWELKDFEFSVVISSNMTSGLLGLGRDSAFLQKLVDEKKIGSRSFGLHLGIDIWNHPWPVLNPSFDESGNKPTTDEDFNSGVGKRKESDEEELPVRESHKFPGSLTLGGYDKSKISNTSKPLIAPISQDGTLQLSLTSMVVHNILPDSPYELLPQPYTAIIDTETPHMYFPQTVARGIGEFMGAVYGEPGIDFFYTYLADRERRIGNVTMTFKSLDGKGDEIEIVVPPTVWYQPVGYMRNYQLTGDNEYNFYAPMKEYRGEEPIVLGRSFLKAAYLFVNHDTNYFQISQVAYVNSTKEIVPISASEDPSPDDKGSVRDVDDSEDNDGSSDGGSTFEKELPMPIPALAGASLGGILFLVALFIFWRKWKRRNAEKHQQLDERPGSADSHIPIGGRMELDANDVAMVKMSRPSTAISMPAEKDSTTLAELPPAAGKQIAPAQGYHELGVKHDYYEMPAAAATGAVLTPKQAQMIVPSPAAVYPPPPPNPSALPGYTHQPFPGHSPASHPAGCAPPPLPCSPLQMPMPAAYGASPPPQPPPGSPYQCIPQQNQGQACQGYPSSQNPAAVIYEMA
ncbi:aspartic peptidase domain-containing protein [Kalaharituber pfeilii]|nr:aspartic peptidase domain-containing protein [Kalaharituber pfeilii]